MTKVAIVTDSNSGITQEQAKELGIFVLPMPFMINEKTYFEDIDLTQEQFYEMLETEGVDICTSQPSPESVMNLWKDVLKEYDEIVHIPMSSGLSGSCQSAMIFAEDFDGKVKVVNNQRISVTQYRSVLDAKILADKGMNAQEIHDALMADRQNNTIYIMLDTLYYLKKGGRITPAAAAIGTLLRLKPVLTVQNGDKLDAFAKARTATQGKSIMVNALKNDVETRLGGFSKEANQWLYVVYSKDRDAAVAFRDEIADQFPGYEIGLAPLSLSVACHVGPGILALGCCKKMQM